MGTFLYDFKPDEREDTQVQNENQQQDQNGDVSQVQEQKIWMNQTALNTQYSFQIMQAKQKVEEERNELQLDYPKDWVEYKKQFTISELTKQFKKQVQMNLTENNRFLNPLIGSDDSVY